MTFHVEQPAGEPIDLLCARLARTMPPPVYWQDAHGWVAYQGRGIYERGRWEAPHGWRSMVRIQPREEWPP